MRNSFRGFGVSFSTNPHVDVDSNGLEDLAIGNIIFFFCQQFNNERVKFGITHYKKYNYKNI